jgi:Helicase associated domain
VSLLPCTSVLTRTLSRTERARAALHAWYDRLQELWEYKQEHGNCLVPQLYPENRKLGVWVNKVRMERRKLVESPNERNSLTADKLQALGEVGFVWAKSKGQESWDLKYEELQAYHAAHGNCDVPTKFGVSLALRSATLSVVP